jgi:DNA-binding IclR family transcriptional regulator
MKQHDKPTPARVEGDRQFVIALARGLDLLRAFRSAEDRLSNQELAQLCSLPKSTVSRLTHTLMELGYLHHVQETGRYRLGIATLALSGTALSRLDLKEASTPVLQELGEQTGAMIFMSFRDDLSMVYIAASQIENCTVGSQLTVGSRVPIGVTAAGRGYLAGAPEDVRAALLSRLKTLAPAGWPRIKDGVTRAMTDLQQHGCVTSFGDWKEEIHGIAMPLSLGTELPMLVLSAAGPARRFSPDVFMDEIRPRMRAAADEITIRHAAQR